MSAERFARSSATDAGPDGLRTQYGALCWRRKNGRTEILLITSRGTGRWIIPKGWPIAGLAPHEAAAREAFEEAGAIGRAGPVPIGLYSYTKIQPDGSGWPCAVSVYALEVRKRVNDFPERAQRRRRWFGRKRASEMVDEPELKQILRQFDHRGLR